jgi:hypothetical protein
MGNPASEPVINKLLKSMKPWIFYICLPYSDLYNVVEKESPHVPNKKNSLVVSALRLSNSVVVGDTQTSRWQVGSLLQVLLGEQLTLFLIDFFILR